VPQVTVSRLRGVRAETASIGCGSRKCEASLSTRCLPAQSRRGPRTSAFVLESVPVECLDRSHRLRTTQVRGRLADTIQNQSRGLLQLWRVFGIVLFSSPSLGPSGRGGGESFSPPPLSSWDLLLRIIAGYSPHFNSYTGSYLSTQSGCRPRTSSFVLDSVPGESGRSA